VPKLQDIQFVIITGMSGAGKTRAIQVFEDLGYFCVDNLPPALLPKFAEMCLQSSGRLNRVALVIDIRGGEFFADLWDALAELEDMHITYHIVFLEADDEVLVRRFKETRRRHPLAPQGSVTEAIRHERQLLQELRGRAHRIIDTSALSPQELRRELGDLFSSAHLGKLMVTVMSFGFKHGLPQDADLVFDVRFLPNPHYVDDLRPLDGGDPRVREYLFRWPITRLTVRRISSFMDFLLPHYIVEGKAQLVVAIGCTGGRHRSVVVAEELARRLRTHEQVAVMVAHRDMDKETSTTGAAPGRKVTGP